MQILPDTQTLASLDPHSLHMELHYESRASLSSSMAYESDSKAAELYHHEYRHFQDVVGTLWGQDYLDLLFAAYDSVLTAPTSELSYPAALTLFDADRAILFPSYYKYVVPGAPRGTPDDRWRMAFSAGVRIRPDGRTDESAPILFVRFDKGTRHVARQPITVGSLLEMRASGAELGVFSQWVQRQPQEEQVIAERLRFREVLGYIYDPELTTYSVASHVAAFFLGQSDVIAMTDAGFKVADIALNLNANAFNRLEHPPGLFGDLSRERLRGFKAQRDRGYAYTVLLGHLRGLAGEVAGEAAIETAVKRSGLRTVDEVFEGARISIERKRNNRLKHPELKVIREALVDAGLTLLCRPNFNAVALLPSRVQQPSPLVMTGEDLAEFYVGVPALTQAQSNFLHDCYSSLREKTRLALRAARGFEFGWSDYVY
jgi:hypothetical protein